MPRYSLMIARFPYGGTEEQETVDWLMKISAELAADKRFEVVNFRIADTPITMTRNRVFQRAIDLGMDYLLLIDSDMAPDIELGADPSAKPFLQTAIDFALNHEGPCVVAAPYCGPPPLENVYVFQWRKWSDLDRPDYSIEQYTREQAGVMSGIQPAAALPTGLMLIDVRALRALPQPHTYYEFAGDGPKCDKCGVAKPGPELDKISTEDVTFTRDLSTLGIPVYCAWDCWAGHVKRHVGRKPRFWTADSVAAKMHAAIKEGRRDGDKMVDVKPPAWLKDRLAAAEAAEKAAIETTTDAAMAVLTPAAREPQAPITAATTVGCTVANPNPADGDGLLRRMLEEQASQYRPTMPRNYGSTVREAEPGGGRIHAMSSVGGEAGHVELPRNAGSLTAEQLFAFDPLAGLVLEYDPTAG